jgi:hypothetical protein
VSEENVILHRDFARRYIEQPIVHVCGFGDLDQRSVAINMMFSQHRMNPMRPQVSHQIADYSIPESLSQI